MIGAGSWSKARGMRKQEVGKRKRGLRRIRPKQEICGGEKRGLSLMCEHHIPTRKVALSDTTAPQLPFCIPGL